MQKGFAPLLILVVVLILGIISFGGYYYYNQHQLKQINSFVDCAKKYPVLESYPAQCNTSDGRHFIQQLSEEEKEKLSPPVDKSNWKTFSHQRYSFKYPEDVKVSVNQVKVSSDDEAVNVLVSDSILIGFNVPSIDIVVRPKEEFIKEGDDLKSITESYFALDTANKGDAGEIVQEVKSTSFLDKPAYNYVVKIVDIEGQELVRKTILVENDGQIFKISLNDTPNLKQVLSTLEFN